MSGMNGIRTTWTTNLTTGLSFWKKFMIFIGLLMAILPGVLLYLYWSKTLEPTLVSDGIKLAVYEKSGRKASPKITKYYYNPNAVVSIHGYSTKSRSLTLLILSAILLFLGLFELINGSSTVLIVAAGVSLIFYFYTKKISVVAINPESNDNVGSGITSFLSVFVKFLLRPILSEEDETVPLVKSFSEPGLKSSGNISLANNSSLIFAVIDEAARAAVYDMRDNFKLYIKK